MEINMRRLTLQIAGSEPVSEKQLISSHSANEIRNENEKKIAN